MADNYDTPPYGDAFSEPPPADAFYDPDEEGDPPAEAEAEAEAGGGYHDPLAKRFWRKVDMSGGGKACWPWTASTVRGYGQFRWNGMRKAHRVAYILTFGAIPEELCVCHRCDNPKCCNPWHLWLGTITANNADRNKKGRQAVREKTTLFRKGYRVAGGNNPRAKLTAEQVAQIRTTYATGAAFQHELATSYKVSLSAVRRILAGTAWAILALESKNGA